MSQEKLQTIVMQNFGGVKEVYYGICASREWLDSVAGRLYIPLKLKCRPNDLHNGEIRKISTREERFEYPMESQNTQLQKEGRILQKKKI